MAELKDAGTLIRLAYEGLKLLNVDADEVLKLASMTVDDLYDSKLRTPHWAQSIFWQQAENVSKDTHIGLSLGQKMPIFKGLVLEHLFVSATDYGDGLKRVLSYQRLVSDAINLRLVEEGEHVYLVFSYPNQDVRHLIDCTLMVLTQLLERNSDGVLRFLAIDIAHSGMAEQSVYERFLHCPVKLGQQENRIYLSKDALATRSMHNHPELLDFHTQYAEAQLADLKRQDLVNDVRQHIASMLEKAEITSEIVAAKLDVPAQDLVVQLREAGTSFSQILNDYRHSLSRKLLVDTEESIAEIVYLTGFSEPSTFYRAFKRWEGMTPVEYRKQASSA